MAVDYTYDTQTQWEEGDFTNAQATDPTGKLTPGVAPETLATNVSENDLSVYLRCREGSGASIENVGSAGDGTLSGGSWAERADGRHYITGGLVTVAYHASMKVAETDDNDDETTSYNWTAQIRVQFGSVAAAVFMQRSNRFQLGMDASGLPYVKNYYHISRVYGEGHSFTDLPQGDPFYLNYTNLVSGSVTVTGTDGTPVGNSYTVDYTAGTITFTSGGDYTAELLVNYIHHEATGWNELADDTALEVDTWYTIGAACNNGALTLYVDGVAVATLSSNYADNDSEEDLVAGFAGDWDQVMYSGNESASNRVSFSNSGSWEKRITLAGDRAARYLDISVALSDEHSISISLAFADTDDDLDYASSWSFSNFVDGTNWIYPPTDGLYHGTHLLIKISCSEGAYDREAVLVDYLKVYLREPATPIAEQTDSPYADVDIEDVTAEDLSALIYEVQNNRTIIKEIYRTVTNLRRATSSNDNYGGADYPGGGDYGSGDITALRSLLNEHIAADSGVHGVYCGSVAGQCDIIDRIAYHSSRFIGVHGIADTRALLDTSHNVSTGVHGLSSRAHVASEEYVAAEISTDLVDGGAIDTAIDTLISAHNVATGVHGAGGSTIATVANIATHSGLDHDVHGVAGDGTQGTIQGGATITGWITDDIGTHAALDTGVHGATGGSFYLARSAQNSVTVETLISNHAALDTGVHGCTESYVLADTKNIADHNSNAVAHTAFGSSLYAHAVDATGIHGIADTSALRTLTQINSLIGDHDDAPAAHGSVESNFASHKDATTGIHGASGNYIAKSTQTFNTVESLISTHEGSGTAHGSVESNFANHKDDGTNVHNVSTVAGLSDITTHSIDTTSVHGIADTSDLCTSPC